MMKNPTRLLLACILFSAISCGDNSNNDQMNNDPASQTQNDPSVHSDINPADDTIPATGTPAPSSEGK